MNPESIIYLNGKFLPEYKALVPVTERGFFGGDGVYEVTRTFRHKLFRLDTHLDRLFRSLAYVRIDPGLTRAELANATEQTLTQNLGRVDAESDYAVWHVITRGDNVTGRPSSTIVSMFCVEIDFDNFAASYLEGIELVTPGVRRTPPDSIDPKAKVLSRMNQIQAAIEVKRANPRATPLMLDAAGNIAETNTGNFFFVADGRLCTSSPRNVLGGVTRTAILEIAKKLGIETVEGDFTPYDIYAADEAFICSTTPVILPVNKLNGTKINDTEGKLPGPVTLRLIKHFIDQAETDFVEQAISRLGDNSSKGMAEKWKERLVTADYII